MIQIAKLYLLIFVAYNSLIIVLFKLDILSNTIFFYRGMAIIVASAILTTSGFLVVHYKTRRWRIESIIAATLISVSFQVAFFVTVPVTLDRSISVFLLDQINNHEQGVSKQDLTSEFVSEYVYNRDAIGRRLFEQTASKNIEVSNGTIKLSNRGRCFLRTAGIIKSLYGM